MSNNVLALIERSNDEVNNLHLSTNTLIREYNNKKTVSNTKKLINFNIEFEKMQKRLDKLKNSMEEVSKLLHNTGKI
jgi:division protein CdvB (Snf7/Vps24/ESCRT-III family)